MMTATRDPPGPGAPPGSLIREREVQEEEKLTIVDAGKPRPEASS